MQLRSFVDAERGAATRLARDVGVSPPLIWQWLSGQRPIPPDRCPAIERASGGKVSCEELRTDVRWLRVPDPDWPHPQGRPCIDVAAPPESSCACFPGTCRGGEVIDGRLANGVRCRLCLPAQETADAPAH